MSKTEMIRARVEPSLKNEAEAVLDRLGMTPTEAITVFYRQIALNRGLPFSVRLPNAATRKALRDAEKGFLREWPDREAIKKAKGRTAGETRGRK